MKLAAGLTSLLCLANLTAPAPFTPAQAYYSTRDRTELRLLKPNETAFYIEDTSANKNNQSKIDTLDYLEHHRVQLKTVTIPHSKLWGTGGTAWYSGWDYYVPDGRLIRVNRAPFAKTWTVPLKEGQADESMRCSTQDGLRLTYGVSVSAGIEDRDAAKYLSYFGVVPPGNPEDPRVAFVSEYFARPLADVMQTFGRNKIAAMVCREIHARRLDADSEASPEIMRHVFAQASKDFMAYGITIHFVGWASKFILDSTIQTSIDAVEVAEKDAVVAQVMTKWIEVLKQTSLTTFMRNFGARTDGQLPRTLQTDPGVFEQLTMTYLKHSPQQLLDAKKTAP